MKIGLLALQGAVPEHRDSMKKLGVDVDEVKKPRDLNNLDGLIVPGGESPTLRKLLKNSKLWDEISNSDIPIMGTCAGAILMGKCKDETFEKMDFRINRNYYGRQTDSFEEDINTADNKRIRGVFIRAPGITSIGNGVKPIAWKGNEIIGCTENKHLALTFHPELTNDVTFHELWIKGLK